MNSCALLAKKPLPSGPVVRAPRAERSSQMPNGPGRLPWFVQPSLRIGAVDDPLEHEAERVADRVTQAGSASLQRSCACEGSGAPCEHCAEQGAIPTAGTVQRSPTVDQGSDATAPQITIDAATRPGRPIDPGARETLEPQFGVSFENVRVHDDAVAAAAAESVGARAYTIGSDVVFGAGEYAPNTTSGQRTLVHELTHVVQNGPCEPDTLDSLRRLPFGIRLPTGIRGLDPKEIAILRRVFASSLDYASIFVSDALGGSGRPFTTVVPMIGTAMQLGPGPYGAPGSDASLIIHEATHCWQSQHHPNAAAFMTNSLASQAAAAVAGGNAYCYIPGKPPGLYAAEQIAEQNENGEPGIRSWVSSASAFSQVAQNIVSLSTPRWETPGAPGVRC